MAPNLNFLENCLRILPADRGKLTDEIERIVFSNALKRLILTLQSVFRKLKLALNQQKIKQKLSNTLRLKFRCLKIIPHRLYHTKIIGDIVKNLQKTNVSVL